MSSNPQRIQQHLENRRSDSEPLVFDPATGKLMIKPKQKTMSSQAPTLDEFMADPTKYPDYECAMDDAGKLRVLMTAETRRRNDMTVFSGMYKPGSGGFFRCISFDTVPNRVVQMLRTLDV